MRSTMLRFRADSRTTSMPHKILAQLLRRSDVSVKKVLIQLYSHSCGVMAGVLVIF